MPSSRLRQPVTARTLLDMKMPGDVRFAPDSRRVAYTVSECDWDDGNLVQHIYVTTTDADASPRQVTRGVSGESGPQWSPDGKWLAFLSARDDADAASDDADEDAGQQVWLLPTDGVGGEAEKLTDAPQGVGAFDWLPDSSGIVYLARAPRPRPLQSLHQEKQDRKDDAVQERADIRPVQLWTVDVDKKAARLLHAGDPGIGELAVSPDGKRVAFTTNGTGEVNDYHLADVWTVERETGTLLKLTDGPGGKFHPVWAPDGGRVFFLRGLDPLLSFSQEQLYSVAAGGGDMVHETAGLPLDVVGWHGVWFDGAGHLYVSVAVGTETHLYRRKNGPLPSSPFGKGEGQESSRVPVRETVTSDLFPSPFPLSESPLRKGEGLGAGASAWHPLLPDAQHIHDWHVAPNGGVALVASSLTEVPEVLWLAPGKTRPETLTSVNEEWQERHALAPAEVVRWRSGEYDIEGVLHLPPGYVEGTRIPLLLALHGGPHGRATQSLTPYSPEQVWAAQGYAVLAPNYRGSEGYGAAFCVASKEDLGGGDWKDCLAGVDWTIAEGIADPDKLGVMGASYGGFLVNWGIAHTDRFQAAVSQFGIFSLSTDFGNSLTPRWETEYLGAFPWDAPFLYTRLSPASYVKNIHTPVLLLHGEGDANTALPNSQEMYQALRLLGRTAEFVHYPREGHGFAEPEHRLDEMRRILAWFDKFVKGSGTPAVLRSGDKQTQGGWEMTVARATLPTYAGRTDKRGRLLEVALALRDTSGAGRPLSLSPADFQLQRRTPTPSRALKPVGVPVDVLEQTVLAEGTGWRFTFAPPPDPKGEQGLAVPVAVTFRIPAGAGVYHFRLRDFAPVAFDVPAADPKDKD